jgi:hypothetical protein
MERPRLAKAAIDVAVLSLGGSEIGDHAAESHVVVALGDAASKRSGARMN